VGGTYYKEPHFNFDPGVLELTGDVCLDGYWQSERYFKDVADIIRDALKVTLPMTGRNLDLSRRIGDVDAVSLHVRRGDYLIDQQVLEWHGVCGLDYYRQAIDYIVDWVKRPEFFVFSDEPEWAKAHLEFDHPVTFIDHNPPDKGYEDLRLMTICRHHIVANSSFSWWGAWLASSNDQIVLAPHKWFATDELDASDIYPANWIKI